MAKLPFIDEAMETMEKINTLVEKHVDNSEEDIVEILIPNDEFFALKFAHAFIRSQENKDVDMAAAMFDADIGYSYKNDKRALVKKADVKEVTIIVKGGLSEAVHGS